jgi:hypothetical protein
MSEAPTNASPASRPLIIGIGGIPMQCQFADVWNVPVVMLHRTYLDAIERAGAIAVVVSPATTVAENPGALLDLLDGLILAGGTTSIRCTTASPHTPSWVASSPCAITPSWRLRLQLWSGIYPSSGSAEGWNC